MSLPLGRRIFGGFCPKRNRGLSAKRKKISPIAIFLIHVHIKQNLGASLLN
jgi:hypothetical protein